MHKYSLKKSELFLFQPWYGSKDLTYHLPDTARIQCSWQWTRGNMGQWRRDKQARWALLLHKRIIQKELPGHSREGQREAKPSAPSVRWAVTLRDLGNSVWERGETPKIWRDSLLSIHQSPEHYTCEEIPQGPGKNHVKGAESRTAKNTKQRTRKKTIPRQNIIQAAHSQWYRENHKAALEKNMLHWKNKGKDDTRALTRKK